MRKHFEEIRKGRQFALPLEREDSEDLGLSEEDEESDSESANECELLEGNCDEEFMARLDRGFLDNVVIVEDAEDDSFVEENSFSQFALGVPEVKVDLACGDHDAPWLDASFDGGEYIVSPHMANTF